MSDFLSMTAAQVEGLPDDKVQEVLAAWVKAKRTELPEALLESKSKAHAKLAKKALYQLKSVGVTVAEKTAPAPVEKTEAPKKNEFQAVLSSVLGTGERAIFFAVPARPAGLELFQGIISDESGILQLERGTSNRNQYRQRMRELADHPELKVLLVDFERMKEELGRALTLNERSKVPVPDGMEGELRRLGVEPRDPDFAVPPPEAKDEELAQRGASLHKEKELNQWLPSESVLAILSERAAAVQASPLALTDAQKHEQLTKKALEAAKEFFTADVRKLYARRLWNMAEVFEASERPEQAAIARAEARRLFNTDAPSAFAEQMFVKVVELTAQAAPSAGRMPMPPGLR